jgi:hypothetical protein
MKEYIEREKALSAQNKSMNLNEMRERLKRIPAANVQPVVFCKNCAVPHNQWTGCPKLGGLVTEPDFYCAFGEPKGDLK